MNPIAHLLDRISFRAKTIIGIALVEAVLLVLLTGSLLGFLHNSNEQQVVQHARVTANVFASTIKDALISNDLETLSSATRQLQSNEGISLVRVIDRSGRVLAEAGQAQLPDGAFVASDSLEDAIDGVFFAESAVQVGGVNIGRTELGFDVSSLEQTYAQASQWAVSLALLELVLVAIFSFVLGNYLVRQIHRFTVGVEEISAGRVGLQLPVSGRDEMARATVALNLMSKEIEQAQRDLEHRVELRTQELGSAQKTMQAILESTPNAIVVCDGAGKINLANGQCASLFGYSTLDMTGMSIEALFPIGFNNELRVAIDEAGIVSGTQSLVFNLELTTQHRDGHYLPVTLSMNAVQTEQGLRIIAVIVDISAQKEHEAALQAAKSAAESANFAKSAFLANMSHEIRTPLNAILGYTWLLKHRKNIEPALSADIDDIDTASMHLLSLVNDVLDISKIEAGELNLEMAPVRLDLMLRDIDRMMRPQAIKKGLKFVCGGIPEEAYSNVIGDSVRLRQILINLLNNAMKFTEHGEVSLSVDLTEMDLSHGKGNAVEHLAFHINDSGSGIPADTLEQLFQPFRQADNSITRKHGGTGLGLSIVKQLCEAMGGRVSVKSVPNQGSSFTVELPFRMATKTETQTIRLDQDLPELDQNKQWLVGVRVLVVDDCQTNLRIAGRILSKQGAEVYTSKSSIAALNWLRQADHVVDIVLMDVQMPDMDGNTAVREIRKLDLLKHLPVIALTGGALASEREKSLDSGMDNYLTKPIDVNLMILTVRKYAETSLGHPVPTSDSSDAMTVPKEIETI